MPWVLGLVMLELYGEYEREERSTAKPRGSFRMRHRAEPGVEALEGFWKVQVS